MVSCCVSFPVNQKLPDTSSCLLLPRYNHIPVRAISAITKADQPNQNPR
jgi:hypothetical protein